jgi:hypothetical protein
VTRGLRIALTTAIGTGTWVLLTYWPQVAFALMGIFVFVAIFYGMVAMVFQGVDW